MTQIRNWAVYSVAVYIGLLLGGAMIETQRGVVASSMPAAWDAAAVDAVDVENTRTAGGDHAATPKPHNAAGG